MWNHCARVQRFSFTECLGDFAPNGLISCDLFFNLVSTWQRRSWMHSGPKYSSKKNFDELNEWGFTSSLLPRKGHEDKYNLSANKNSIYLHQWFRAHQRYSGHVETQIHFIDAPQFVTNDQRTHPQIIAKQELAAVTSRCVARWNHKIHIIQLHSIFVLTDRWEWAPWTKKKRNRFSLLFFSTCLRNAMLSQNVVKEINKYAAIETRQSGHLAVANQLRPSGRPNQL